MELKRVHALRLSGALVVAAVSAMILGGCPAAAKTATDLRVGIEGMRVALIPMLTEGSPMTAITLPEAKGASGTLTYSVMPEIPGLSFNPTTRALSGTPTVAGTYPVTYSATTSAGEKASLRFTVKVLSSFVGTWASSGSWWDDGQDIGTWKQALTFTESRYILYRSYYLTGSTSVDHAWVKSGTWEATDTTVTKIWEEDHDGDDIPEVKRVRKNYLWGEGREALCMQYWDNDEVEMENVGCDRYTRVRDPIPGSIAGVWGFEDTFDREEGQSTGVWTFTIDGDTFTEHYVESGATSEIWTLTGSVRHVAEENYLYFTVISLTVDGSPATDALHTTYVGHELRAAYAPTDIDNQIVFSYYYHESSYDEATDKWIDENPYGNYRFTLVRQTK